MNKLIVAYGSNLNLRQMAGRCPDSVVEGAGVLHGFRLVFRGPNCSGVANIERAIGCQVPVLLWSVPPLDEEILDQYEGLPWLYVKKRVTVNRPDVGPVTAWAYVMRQDWPLLAPGLGYFRAIMRGYLDAGFDPQPLWEAAKRSSQSRPESYYGLFGHQLF